MSGLARTSRRTCSKSMLLWSPALRNPTPPAGLKFCGMDLRHPAIADLKNNAPPTAAESPCRTRTHPAPSLSDRHCTLVPHPHAHTNNQPLERIKGYTSERNALEVTATLSALMDWVGFDILPQFEKFFCLGGWPTHKTTDTSGGGPPSASLISTNHNERVPHPSRTLRSVGVSTRWSSICFSSHFNPTA